MCFFWLLIGNKWIFGEEKRVEREVGKDPSDVDIEKDVSEDHQMDKEGYTRYYSAYINPIGKDPCHAILKN